MRPAQIEDTYMSNVTYECLVGYWMRPGLHAVTIECDIQGDWQPTVTDCTGEVWRGDGEKRESRGGDRRGGREEGLLDETGISQIYINLKEMC